MTTDAKVRIGNTADFLEGTSVDTTAGTSLFREGVVISDPETPDARAKILDSQPSSSEFGLIVRSAGISDVRGAHFVSTANSTSTPLGANATFTGTFEDVLDYLSISIVVNTDHIATTGGLLIDFSTNGTNIDRTVTVDILTSGCYTNISPEARFFRLRIVNGNQAQTFLRAQVQLNSFAEAVKSVPLNDRVTLASSALVTKGSIIGLSSSGGGTFVDVKVNPSGSLQTEVTGTVAVSGQVQVVEPVTVVPDTPTTGSVTNVAASTTQVTLLAANANRKGATIYNASTGTMLYVSLGSTVNLTLFTIRIDADGYYEVPFNYVGPIVGVFSAATGGANVTELT
jgi:hypothetical protein